MTTAHELRQALADALVAGGAVRSAAVEAAFRTVPREAFVPAGTDLATAYADQVVVTRRDPGGRATSSVSAPWLQALMIEQAALLPGARVLEVGSGGYHAALLAEVVGPHGRITSIDIDPYVVGHARAALARAGYPQVRVVETDGEYGHPAAAPYDAVIVTVEAGDVPPAWTDQLAPGGVLVAPLRIRGNTRSVALIRDGDHLVAASALPCGFVPMQGAGARAVRRLPLRGDAVVLAVDDNATDVDPAVLGAALDGPLWEAWSAVTTSATEPFDSLHLWLASQPRPYGLLAVDPSRVGGRLRPQNSTACPTLVSADSLAHLALRQIDADAWQFGAQGFGPHAERLVVDLLHLLDAWDRRHRHGPGPRITVHRAGTALAPTESPRLLLPRRHTTVAVTWPVP
ncbi:methyltransferase, FxLD system [Micromonospora sp. MS34]|uniref:methyltransferase, FxLD system n=1 Tax=Micromonospora sp. MS34 TaxID=3385971 RepID=UPI0039A39FAF